MTTHMYGNLKLFAGRTALQLGLAEPAAGVGRLLGPALRGGGAAEVAVKVGALGRRQVHLSCWDVAELSREAGQDRVEDPVDGDSDPIVS